MALIHSEIILTHMVCNFIPTKYCTSLLSTDVVESLTFEQREVNIHVCNLNGSSNTFFVFKNHSLAMHCWFQFGLVL